MLVCQGLVFLGLDNALFLFRAYVEEDKFNDFPYFRGMSRLGFLLNSLFPGSAADPLLVGSILDLVCIC